MPFQELRKQDVPSWWTGYNATKHRLPEGMSRATYANTMNALAALVILLHISYSSILISDARKMLDSRNWTIYSGALKNDYKLLKFSEATTVHFATARREYLRSQEQIYKSKTFYYLAEYHGG
ncbi:MAG: hypothetical protein ACREBU_02955 [Nitrososphaera sp.]